MKSRQLMFIVSIVIAAAAGFLAWNYLSTISKSQTTAVMRSVLIATKDIQARSQITPAMLTTQTRPATSVDPDALSDPNSITNFIALTSIPSGAVLTKSRVGKPEEAPLPVRLKAGMRAVTIPIDSVRGVAGLIEPGDHVDVIAVMNRGYGSGSAVSTFLHDVLVLAMGTALEQQHNPQTTESPNATTATLAVSPKQAELLTLADSVAQLRLSLRPPGDKANQVVDTFNMATPMPPRLEAPAPQAPVIVQRVVEAAPAAAKPRQLPHELMVTVIDGDHVVGSQR
jgi:pilus assembly protein CpaB